MLIGSPEHKFIYWRYLFFSFTIHILHMKGSHVSTHLHNHFHSGQGGGDVLGMWWSHCNWYTAGIQASVKGSNQIYTCKL